VDEWKRRGKEVVTAEPERVARRHERLPVLKRDVTSDGDGHHRGKHA
jgi:hypothetical protein